MKAVGLVGSFLEDREGNIWIGTEKGGLIRQQLRRVGGLSEESGLPNENVWALCEDKSGRVWIGTDGGICLWRDGQVASLPLTNQLSDPKVRALHVDERGALWIGTGGGLDQLDPSQLILPSVTHHRWSDNKPLNKVRVIKSDRAGNLWVGRAVGLMLYRDGRWTQFTTTNGLPNDDVRAIHADRDGRLWIATYGGGVAVSKFEVQGSRFKVESVLTTTNELPSNFAWALHEDSDGILWIGTERGLGRMDLSRFGRTGDSPVPSGDSPDGRRTTRPANHDASFERRALPIPAGGSPAGTGGSPVPPFIKVGSPAVAFTKTHGLFEEAINEIVEDDFGRLWLSSDRGIMRVDKRELNAVASGRTNQVACVVYTESDGLLSSECNGQKSQPAGIKARDGRLWFPTTKGVVIIDPRKLDELDSRPPVLIEQIVVDGEKIFENLPGARLSGVNSQLAPGRARAFEVHYTAPTFKAPEKVRFRHRLVGFDSDWVEAETRRVAYYTNLKPGRYRFEVLAANNHSLWSERAAAFEFTLAPHYWQAWWFQPLCWGGALATFGLAVWHLRRAHQDRQRIALMDERGRIARDMHDELGSQLSQLNLALANQETQSPARASQLVFGAEQTLDEIIWAMQSDEDRLDRLIIYVTQHGCEHVTAAGIDFEADIPDAIPARPISSLFRKHVLLAVKEALTNAVRHARAKRVVLRVRVEERSLTIAIVDDGKGFDASAGLTEKTISPDAQLRRAVASDSPPARNHGGNGLANMRHRIETCGGRMEIVSGSGPGTTVRFHLPLPP